MEEVDLDAAMDRGEEVLNEKRPDWMWVVNLDTLDMSSLELCLLAQVRPKEAASGFSGWGQGVQWFSEGKSSQRHLHWASSHGFDVLAGESHLFPEMNRKWWDRIVRARERHPR